MPTRIAAMPLPPDASARQRATFAAGIDLGWRRYGDQRRVVMELHIGRDAIDLVQRADEEIGDVGERGITLHPAPLLEIALAVVERISQSGQCRQFLRRDLILAR